MHKFFLEHAPIILFINVLSLHILGYIFFKYAFPHFAFGIWLIIGLVDSTLAFFCGRLIKKLDILAYTDSLTRLKNRGYFYSLLPDQLELASNQKQLSILFLDIDNFKAINDGFGHLAGDKILIRISDTMRNNIRDGDTVIRWGGEEFAVILPKTDRNGAIQLAERLRNDIESQIYDRAKVTVSIGVSTSNKTMDVDTFVKLADKALYKAKEIKNSVVFSDTI
jgi:diguanylate cyclase (GGDEF)-like protein